jgi:hypothetical protein
MGYQVIIMVIHKHNINTLLYVHSIGPKCKIAGRAGVRYIRDDVYELVEVVGTGNQVNGGRQIF